MPATARPVLSALCSPADAQRIMRGEGPPEAFAHHGAPARLPSALTVPELASLERLFASYDGLVCFGNSRTGASTLSVERASAAMLFQMGLSLYLPDIADRLASLPPLLRQLEQELGAPPGAARIGAFAAPAGNGATCHFDAEEVFSIQLVGEKCFQIARASEIDAPYGMQFNPGLPCQEDLYPQAPAGFPNPDRAIFETVHMRPGSVLFMPRGTWHWTEAGGESLSVSIIVRMPSALDCALAALRNRMLQQPRWRRPLYGAWGNADDRQSAQAQWGELMASGGALTAGLALEDALVAMLPERERRAWATPATRFQRRPESRLEFSDRPGGGLDARVACRNQSGVESVPLRLEVPLAMIPMFRWLAAREAAFGLADLQADCPGVESALYLQVADALVRGGYLRQLWFGPPGGSIL